MLRVLSKKSEWKETVSAGSTSGDWMLGEAMSGGSTPEDPAPKKPKRQVQFAGICKDAKALGVCREHLYRVLTGKRTSQSLLKRYLELKSKSNKPPGSTPA